jgi:hypothetical protein
VRVAELLVAVRLKFVERELGEAEPCTDARLKYLKLGMDITSDIAGDTGLIRSLLTDPHADDTARPAAGAPEPTLSDAPDRVRWLPWQCCTASWQAAYNTACLYAAFAELVPETAARVVLALERAINNPDSEMERAYDWVSRDPDFTALQNVPQFKDFRESQERRDYPAAFEARVPPPRRENRAPTAIRSGKAV